MRHVRFVFLGIFFGVAMLFAPVHGICSNEMPIPYPDVPRMPQKQCVKLLEKVPPPIIIDVRPTLQYKESLEKLPDAVHEDPEKVRSWAHKYKKDRTLILY